MSENAVKKIDKGENLLSSELSLSLASTYNAYGLPRYLVSIPVLG